MQFPRLKRYFHLVGIDGAMEAMIPAKHWLPNSSTTMPPDTKGVLGPMLEYANMQTLQNLQNLQSLKSWDPCL